MLSILPLPGISPQSLLEHYPGESLAIFASKAHSTLALAALVAAEGLGWDAVSEGELLTGLQV